MEKKETTKLWCWWQCSWWQRHVSSSIGNLAPCHMALHSVSVAAFLPPKRKNNQLLASLQSSSITFDATFSKHT